MANRTAEILASISAMRWGLTFGAALTAALACTSREYFVCSEDSECRGAAAAGQCQLSGACSFPDDECPSGQRYGGAGEPSLAGECVDPATSTSEGPEDSSTSGAAPSSTGDPTDPVPNTTGDACPTSWWDCAWAHRQRLALTTPIEGELTHVPVLVLLRAGRVNHQLMQADGEDVRFVSASGLVAPYEIERWDPAGVSSIWINVDALGGAADHLWLYYGNPVAENAEDPAGVWPEPFAAVWHMEDDPVDSTPHANDAVPSGTTTVVTAHISNGRDITSSSARLDVGAPPSLAELFAGGGTVSAWIRLRNWGSSGYGRIADKVGSNEGWRFNVANGGSLRFAIWLDPNTYQEWLTLPDTIERHRWIHVAVTHDALGAEPPQLFIDGVPSELDAPAIPPMVDAVPSDLDVPLALGNRVSNDRRFDGVLDEVRIERTTRSAEWIRVQYEAMNDALLGYGAIESWEAP